MTTYGLYLESGPKHMKTMVHVPQLLGCIANGPTTDDALLATPDAIRAYLRFLKRLGEDVDPEAEFSLQVVEHITEGEWLGNGSPYVAFASDYEPVSEDDIEMFVRRLHGLRSALIGWAAAQDPARLDEKPAKGRSARAILRHVTSPTAGYLSPVLGTIAGASRVQTLVDRGELSEPEALRRIEELVVERVRAATAEERSAVVQRPKEVRTLRKGLRRALEHDWEHLVELSRRPGGPEL